jgi:putative phage-type endonuclease
VQKEQVTTDSFISGEESEQGTSAWLNFRKNKIGASDAPILMMVSPWSTPYALWRDKKGLNTNPNAVPGKSMNFAIERGVRFEPIARARYEIHNDIPMDVAVMAHPEFPWMIASLDGYNKEAKRVLEIKICGREVMQEAKAGRVHIRYAYQLEQQLLVTAADVVDFYCCTVEVVNGREKITDTALVVYKSNPDLREKLIPKLHEFYGFMQRNEPPPLCDRDVLIYDDQKTKDLFSSIGSLESEIVDLATKLDSLIDKQANLKAAASSFITHKKVRAGNVEFRQSKKDPERWDIKIHKEKTA